MAGLLVAPRTSPLPCPCQVSPALLLCLRYSLLIPVGMSRFSLRAQLAREPPPPGSVCVPHSAHSRTCSPTQLPGTGLGPDVLVAFCLSGSLRGGISGARPIHWETSLGAGARNKDFILQTDRPRRRQSSAAKNHLPQVTIQASTERRGGCGGGELLGVSR